MTEETSTMTTAAAAQAPTTLQIRDQKEGKIVAKIILSSLRKTNTTSSTRDFGYIGTLQQTILMIYIASKLKEEQDYLQEKAKKLADSGATNVYLSDYHGMLKEYMEALLSSGFIDSEAFFSKINKAKLEKELGKELVDKINKCFTKSFLTEHNEICEIFKDKDAEWLKTTLKKFKETEFIVFKNRSNPKEKPITFAEFLKKLDTSEIDAANYVPIFNVQPNKKNKQKLHLTDIGDQVDRGLFSLICLLTIVNLKQQALETITLMPGNHGDFYVAEDFESISFNAGKLPFENSEYEKYNKQYIEELARLFDFELFDFYSYVKKGEQIFFASHTFITPETLTRIIEKCETDKSQQEKYKKDFFDAEGHIKLEGLNENLKKFIKSHRDNLRDILYELDFTRLTREDSKLLEFTDGTGCLKRSENKKLIFPNNTTIIIGHTYKNLVLKFLPSFKKGRNHSITHYPYRLVLTDNNIPCFRVPAISYLNEKGYIVTIQVKQNQEQEVFMVTPQNGTYQIPIKNIFIVRI